MKITVIGAGYVGLVTAACLADVGNDVLCLDLDASKVDRLRAGEMPIFEPGLEQLVESNAKAKRLFFTTSPLEAARHGQVQFIAVGTPPGEDGSADLKYVLAAARSIAEHMGEYRVVVGKSTVPVGTADLVAKTIKEVLKQRGVEVPFAVVSNPEFLKEGSAIEDFLRPDRIVLGSEDDKATQLLRQIYSPFERNHAKLMVMDVRSAELTKYAANAMLATRISFMNELALLAEKVGADIDWVRKGIGSDHRIGTHFLYAGCGYGGSCFPKDVKALLRTGSEHSQPLRVLRAVEEANEAQKLILCRKITALFGEDLSSKVIAVWGLAFKPNTDDMREAPSIPLIRELLDRGAIVRAYDPVSMTEAAKLLGAHERLRLVSTAQHAVEKADALVIVTEWKEFRSPDLERLRTSLRQPLVIDGRNILDPDAARAAGLEYIGIGRVGSSTLRAIHVGLKG